MVCFIFMSDIHRRPCDCRISELSTWVRSVRSNSTAVMARHRRHDHIEYESRDQTMKVQGYRMWYTLLTRVYICYQASSKIDVLPGASNFSFLLLLVNGRADIVQDLTILTSATSSSIPLPPKPPSPPSSPSDTALDQY